MKINSGPEAIEEVLTKGVETIYPSFEALKKRMMSGKKMKLYCGYDPSSPSLHIGHLATLRKLADFQALGHEVIMLIGDFTGTIGDPTGKLQARKKLTRKEVIKNAKNYKDKAAKIIDFTGTNPAKLLYNSKWLDKLSFNDLIELASNFTVQQMIIRDMFQQRIKQNKPVFLHEFLYPLAQAYDSVAMDVDLEVGGNDQTFNMLAGRELMRILKGKEKFVLTARLLTDAQGKKMGKTEGNALNVNDSPKDMRGKIMKLPDEVIDQVFDSCTKINSKTLKSLLPRDKKEKLADEIVKTFYGETEAEKTKKEFNKVFREKELPSEMTSVKISEHALGLLDLLVTLKLASSKSDAKRLVIQKGVKIDGKVEDDWKKTIDIKKGMVIQIGRRRFAKII